MSADDLPSSGAPQPGVMTSVADSPEVELPHDSGLATMPGLVIHEHMVAATGEPERRRAQRCPSANRPAAKRLARDARPLRTASAGRSHVKTVPHFRC